MTKLSMTKKERFDGVEDTLFIPLAGRAYTSKKFPHVFFDKKALEVCKKIDLNQLVADSGDYLMLANAIRYRRLDRLVKDFISEHKVVNVINIGAGLETMFYRMAKSQATFYELDLPHVIDIRNKYLCESDREVFIKGDMFDMTWARDIDKAKPTLIVVSGVFPYFSEDKVIQVITQVLETFDKIELVFDAPSSIGKSITNKYIKKTGNHNAQMLFSINIGKRFSKKMANKLRLKNRIDFFGEDKKKLKGKVHWYIYFKIHVTDYAKMTSLYHFEKVNDD